jgi:transcriptional regulator with XRE-family HTH domain
MTEPEEKRPFLSVTARKELRGWMDEKRLSYNSLGELLGYSRNYVAHWINGVSRPKFIDWMKLEHLTGIPWSHWLTRAERDEIRAAKIEIDRLRRARPVPELSVRERYAGRI